MCFFFPPDIKPELLDLEPPMSPVAGPSHSQDENSMMMYMDQSMSGLPGPSGYQDNSALVSTDSQPQGKYLSLLLNTLCEREQQSDLTQNSGPILLLMKASWQKIYSARFL